MVTMCVVLFTKCGKDGGGDLDPNANFTVDLSKNLKEPGDFVIVNRIIVIRKMKGNAPEDFIALSGICTYLGCTVAGYSKVDSTIKCVCHGCLFNMQGHVIGGPAKSDLRRYQVSLPSTGVLSVNN
jgi:Rieske Fe-S protein